MLSDLSKEVPSLLTTCSLRFLIGLLVMVVAAAVVLIGVGSLG